MIQKLETIKNRINIEYLVLVIVLLCYALSLIIFPEQGIRSTEIAADYLQEMALIIPPVFLLMGLFEIWVPKEFVQKYMGKEAGFKGFILSFVFGTLPAGPVYVAFPLAAALYRKGARVRNIIVFIGVWAAAKLPQIMVEIQFLGVDFAMVRLILTVIFMMLLGIVIEFIVGKTNICIETNIKEEKTEDEKDSTMEGNTSASEG